MDQRDAASRFISEVITRNATVLGVELLTHISHCAWEGYSS